MKTDWQTRWNPKAYWRGTTEFSAYREDLVLKVLRVVSEWKRQRQKVAKLDKNLAFLCGRLEILVEECGASVWLPDASGEDLEVLAHDLADFLSVLPETDCWDLHPPTATQGVSPPPICNDCPFVGPVSGLSGDEKYFGCDTLTFFGWKLVDWRAGSPRNAWPEPGVWYSAFETNRRRH